MPSFSLALILFGVALAIASQFAMAFYTFAGNPLKGVMCIVVPMYGVVQSKKSKVGKRLIAAWFFGIGFMVVGGMLAP